MLGKTKAVAGAAGQPPKPQKRDNTFSNPATHVRIAARAR